uniref:Uncharacterized protein n=1 Tax=Anguilla anguilla TaxID=7936 RepID=A0A0E9PU13_ANGAN
MKMAAQSGNKIAFPHHKQSLNLHLQCDEYDRQQRISCDYHLSTLPLLMEETSY